MKLTARPTFVTDDGRSLSFVRLKDDTHPGFTHRVIIDQRAVDYLAQGKRADAKSARFFLEKYAAQQPASAA